MAISGSRPRIEHAWVVVAEASRGGSGSGAVLDSMRSSVWAVASTSGPRAPAPVPNDPHRKSVGRTRVHLRLSDDCVGLTCEQGL